MTVGNPALDGVRMGPVATRGQLEEVRAGVAQLARDGRLVFGRGELEPVGVPKGKGFFTTAVLLEVEAGAPAPSVHSREVFGPVATIVPYSGGAEEAAELVGRGRGGLVSSVYSEDEAFTAEVVRAIAPYHGRVFLGSAKIAEASPGPGTVLPLLVHGGPGWPAHHGGGCGAVALEGSRPVIERIVR